MRHLLTLIFALSLPGLLSAEEDLTKRIEVGKVAWGRDLDAALAKSKMSGIPVMILFQEVPGCGGCQTFGRDVLSNPEIVKLIETEFVPVLVFNNQPVDRALLKRFDEPAWNYQVIRFLDAEAKDIIPRDGKVMKLPAIAKRMAEALKAHGRPVPPVLEKLAIEPAAPAAAR
jgi:hypothetical protein